MEWLDKHPPDHRATPEEAGDYLLSMTQASVEAISNIVHKGRSYTVHKHKYYLGGGAPLSSVSKHTYKPSYSYSVTPPARKVSGVANLKPPVT